MNIYLNFYPVNINTGTIDHLLRLDLSSLFILMGNVFVINLKDIKKLPVVYILLEISRVQQGDVKTDLVDISG